MAKCGCTNHIDICGNGPHTNVLNYISAKKFLKSVTEKMKMIGVLPVRGKYLCVKCYEHFKNEQNTNSNDVDAKVAEIVTLINQNVSINRNSDRNW